MKKTTRNPLKLGLLLLLIPTVALAWWNNDWTSRKPLTLDTGATGADIQETLSDFPLLLRLHTGNFGYFAELAENGKDLRFMLDDKTALKHHVEKVDALAELGLVWVKLPTVRGGVSTDTFSMYYGNANVADASDPKGIYDVNQALVFHFNEGETLPQDATAYSVHASASKASIDPAGWIGAAAKFDGGGISVNAVPALAVSPDGGWTFSTWAKIDQAQQNAVLVQAKDNAAQITLLVQGSALIAQYQGTDGSIAKTAPTPITLNQWQHIAVTAQKDKLTVYLNGQAVSNTPINLVALNPSLLIGEGFTGLLDEVQIAKQARSADWIKLQFRSQSPDFTVVNLGQDESGGATEGPNYFVVILQSLTVDGWVVIALCGVMFVISLLVMIGKGLTLKRASKDNAAFLKQYRTVDAEHLGALDRDESEEDQEIGASEFLSSVIGKHDHFQGSPIYHVYHAGVHELKINFGDNAILTPEALNLVRSRLDAAVVRETQKLNKSMVLLTIAISGGPFLGLLGTVMGVMITFAVIAATGDVNINSIAPGISGALAATVAGLAVAIPALFAYNYLLTQIKDVTADMHVFTDEFLAMVSKRVADRQRGDSGLNVLFTEEFINLIAERIAAKQPEKTA
jgi:biopolymer transport protein ExbB